MKQLWMTALLLLLALSVTACGGTPEADDPEEPAQTQLANPFVTYDTMEDAAQAVGFNLGLPDGVDWADEAGYQVMADSMLQATYLSEDRTLTLRKAAGENDISGDYNSYPEVSEETIGDRTVTCKGKNGLVYTAIWQEDGYSFSLTDDHGLDGATLTVYLSRIA